MLSSGAEALWAEGQSMEQSMEQTQWQSGGQAQTQTQVPMVLGGGGVTYWADSSSSPDATSTPASASASASLPYSLPLPRPKPFLPPKKIMKGVGLAVRDWGMIKDGDRLLLGLSGGKDSLALLHILLALQVRGDDICDM
jgi:hypothetical protein